MNDDEAKIVGLSPVSFEISTHHIDANGAFAGVSRVGRFGAKNYHAEWMPNIGLPLLPAVGS